MFTAAMLVPGAAAAQPSGDPPPVQKPTAPEPAPTPQPDPAPSPAPDPAPAPAAKTAEPAVDDAAWSALEKKNVVIETNSGPVEGELIRSDGPTLVLVKKDGTVKTLHKTRATGVKVAQPPAPPPKPSQEIADLEPPAEDEADEDPEDEELTPGEKRRKERRENRKHALLGAFTMQGVTYSHWRGDGIRSGHASYAMDWGIGANLSPSFGMYAVGGGLFATKLEGGSTKGNYGHIDFMFAFGGKYYFSMIGAGGGFSRLRYEDGRLEKDSGLSIPGKLMGKIPLPHKLYIGLGITYEFAAVRGFDRFINAIGGQLVVGRW